MIICLMSIGKHSKMLVTNNLERQTREDVRKIKVQTSACMHLSIILTKERVLIYTMAIFCMHALDNRCIPEYWLGHQYVGMEEHLQLIAQTRTQGHFLASEKQ